MRRRILSAASCRGEASSLLIAVACHRLTHPCAQAEDWYRQLLRSQQQTLAVAGRDPLSHSADAAAFESDAGSSLGAPSEGGAAPAAGATAAAAAAGGEKAPVRRPAL